MPTILTTIRLSDRVRDMLEELAEGEARQRTALIERALEDLCRRELAGIIWQGTGPWEGWSLSTAHASSSRRQPVLVRPDGSALGPGDIRKR